MTRRLGLVLLLAMMAGCAGVSPPDANDICRGSARCSPQCGSVASGSSSECDPYQNGGHTRG